MASFWDTLTASGAQAASKVLAPLSGGLSAGIANLVQTGQNKVGQLASTIATTTDPNKPTASQPSRPPTTTKTPPPSTAQTQASLGIFMVIAVIVLILFLKGRK